MDKNSLAAVLHRAAFLREIDGVDDFARIARLPTSVVLDAVRSGAIKGREFPGLGWRITKRSALEWIEARSPGSEASDGR